MTSSPDFRMKLLVILCTSSPVANAAAESDDKTYASMISQVAPDDFRALLALQSRPTEFSLPNGSTFSTEANLGHARIALNTESNRDAMREFLLENDISSEGVKIILDRLDTGMESDTRCRGDRQRCQITPETQFSVVVDAPREQVRLIPSPELYARTSGIPDYFSAHNENPALINRVNLYTSYVDGTSSTTLNDRVILGLPWGHLRSELSAYDNEGERSSSADTLEYNLDIQGWRLMAGRSRSFNTQNTTSLLNFSSQQKEGVYIMSSRNLMRGQSGTWQRVYFYMPQRGVVEAWRDGQMLLSQPAEAGQQFLTYDQLPPGVYTLTLKMKADNNVLTEQQVSIVNNPSVTLPVGQVDWTLGAASISNDYTSLTAGELDVALRPLDALQLAAGVNVAQNEQLYSAGGSWTVTSDIRIDMAAGRFSDQATYWQSTLSWLSTYLTWQSYRASDEVKNAPAGRPLVSDEPGDDPAQYRYQTRSSSLSGVMLGSDDYDQVSLTTSYPLGAASAYTSLYYNYRATGGSDESYRSLNLSTGVTTPFIMNSTLGLNLMAGRSKTLSGSNRGDERNDFSVSLNWSLPLGDRRQVNSNLQYNKEGGSLASATVRQQFTHTKNLTSNLEAGGRWRDGQNGESEATITGSVNHNGEMFTASGSGTLNSREGNVMFASLGGSQVISRQGLFLTASDSESFLLLRNRTPETKTAPVSVPETESLLRPASGQLTMRNSSTKYSTSRNYHPEAGAMLTPLERYRTWSFRLHTDNAALYNAGDREARGFSFPGSVVPLEPRLEKEYQLIGAFYLPDGKPAERLDCEGTSCLQVEKLDAGLFRVLLGGSGSFRLLSGDTLCLAERQPDTSARLTRLPEVRCQTMLSDGAPLQLTARPGAEPELTQAPPPQTTTLSSAL